MENYFESLNENVKSAYRKKITLERVGRGETQSITISEMIGIKML